MTGMPTIEFTPNLRRHVACPTESLAAATLAECLDSYFGRWPDVRGYILDDQGGVRHHVKIMIDGRNIRDRLDLSDPLTPGSRVHVFQALSGG
jgi:molybdopterin converting factor small subunit